MQYSENISYGWLLILVGFLFVAWPLLYRVAQLLFLAAKPTAQERAQKEECWKQLDETKKKTNYWKAKYMAALAEAEDAKEE